MIFVAHRINTIKELEMVPSKFGVEVDITNYTDKQYETREKQHINNLNH